MTHKQKRLLKKGVITPVIIAVVLSLFLTAVLNVVADDYLAGESIVFSSYNPCGINTIDSFDGEIGSTVNRRDIGNIDGDIIIGDITIYDNNFPLIYNANEVNACGKVNIVNDKIIGETGACFLEIYKTDSSKIRLISTDDVVVANTFYSSYEYKVVDTFVAKNENELKHAANSIDKALVIYTDNSLKVGISDEYFVIVCQMTEGTPVVG